MSWNYGVLHLMEILTEWNLQFKPFLGFCHRTGICEFPSGKLYISIMCFLENFPVWNSELVKLLFWVNKCPVLAFPFFCIRRDTSAHKDLCTPHWHFWHPSYLVVSCVCSFFADIKSQYLAHPANVTKRLGETATFDCTIQESLPYASIQWYKDGSLFTQGEVAGQIHIPGTKATSSALSVKSITFSSAGWYGCVAINPLLPNQPQSSKRAYLTVLRKYNLLLILLMIWIFQFFKFYCSLFHRGNLTRVSSVCEVVQTFLFLTFQQRKWTLEVAFKMLNSNCLLLIIPQSLKRIVKNLHV